jgi:hypothetical protein
MGSIVAIAEISLGAQDRTLRNATPHATLHFSSVVNVLSLALSHPGHPVVLVRTTNGRRRKTLRKDKKKMKRRRRRK